MQTAKIKRNMKRCGYLWKPLHSGSCRVIPFLLIVWGGLFTLSTACLSSLWWKITMWRYAPLRSLILQTRLNGFPLEGLWLIPDAYSIPCGHCSRKFPLDRANEQQSQTSMYETETTKVRALYFELLLTHRKCCHCYARKIVIHRTNA